MKRYDVYSQFAHRHLGGREERAVYLTFVAQEADSWSVDEIAERNQLPLDQVERVLEEFHAAGIVEPIEVTGQRRYRWRSDMNYVFGAREPSAEWIDPVCGMPVLAQSPHVAEDVYGRPRRFCSSLCLTAFRAFPSTFSGPVPSNVRLGA